MPTSFFTKINRRLVGSDVFISGEAHVIPATTPFIVRLHEVPLLDTGKDVVIPTFSRVAAAPSLNEFSVDWSTGVVTFNSGNASQAISVDYYGTGSIVYADDPNFLQIAVNALEVEVETARGTEASLDGRLDASLKEDGVLKDYIVAPVNISNVITDDFTFPNDVTISNTLFLGLLVSDPTSPSEGQIWYNVSDHQWKGRNDTSIVILG